ncbi:MAG: ketoacyl-ACP synthase III [Bacteroidia bacterium]|nr:ketoacyl-ACP synthase III [Bacteroidia bacterium]
MFLTAISHFVPSGRVPNSYFEAVNGLTEDWIETRTGIKTRSKAAEDENTHTMAVEAVKALREKLSFPLDQIDLIVGGTYSPYDTVATMGHIIQKEIGADHIPVVTVSSACSSFLNAVEVAQGYFAMGKATKALVVVSEHNSLYANESDPQAGHLWGDGAAALVITKERSKDTDLRIIDLVTGGAAGVGKGTEGVVLRPRHGGIIMEHGRDVFIHACEYMARVSEELMTKNGITLDQLSYFVPHQANLRISKNVAGKLGLPMERVLSNIQEYGNTGCAGCAIALSEHRDELKPGEIIVMAVFGGGYSYGSMLLEVGG